MNKLVFFFFGFLDCAVYQKKMGKLRDSFRVVPEEC